MFGRKKQLKTGGDDLHLPSPRLTRTGLRLILINIALPIMLVLVVIDYALYMFFKYALDRCYGVWCMF
ncbi:hypothetical protein [Parvularcula sp. LCG005]|uniref:hypothetical protein n=1 Tax=Parvularcula sp. LCG005 TaxID=3078805 RepID=UPI00294303DE|nr:hypothetical protein [Parvularcula sp. LCG005]WOI54587.1 hypothetical protein RUI03_06205 [Parvularcula sp. LCG005]